MDKLSDIGTIKSVLSRHGFSFSKGLGQNFLINPTVCPRMADAATEQGGRVGVLEVGPGIGVLTNELSKRAHKVVAVELDTRLLPILDETLADCENVDIINSDILKLDIMQTLRTRFEGCDSISICANLPYYITSPVIMRLLEEKLPVASITVMVQKEAAARLCAKVGSRESGAVTVAVAYYAQPSVLFGVSRGSFMPAPNVDSAVISLIPRNNPPCDVGCEDIFFRIVKAGFAQRRKTLPNALSGGLGIAKDKCALILERAQISATARIEQLDMDALGRLSRAAAELM